MKQKQVKAGVKVVHSITGTRWLVLARNYNEVILGLISDVQADQRVLSWDVFERYFDLIAQQSSEELKGSTTGEKGGE